MWLYFSKLFTGRGGGGGWGGGWNLVLGLQFAYPALEEGWILVRISSDDKRQLYMSQDSLWSWPGSSTIPLRQCIPLEWIFSLKVIPMRIWAVTICYGYFSSMRRDNGIYFVPCAGDGARKEATVSFCCPPDWRGAPRSGPQGLRANFPHPPLCQPLSPHFVLTPTLWSLSTSSSLSIFSWNKQMRS